MFRYVKLKRSVFPMLTCDIRKFHITSKVHVRKVLRRENFSESSISESVEPAAIENNSRRLAPQDSNTDFFGIISDTGVITLGSPQNKPLHSATNPGLREKFHRSTFGIIRYDSENKLNFHGQYQKKDDFSFPRKNMENAEVSGSLKNLTTNRRKRLSDNNKVNKNISESCTVEKRDFDENYVGEHYFGNISEKDNDNRPLSEEVNFIDKNYFETSTALENCKLPERDIFKKENTCSNDIQTPLELSEKTRDFSESYVDEQFFGNILEKDINQNHPSSEKMNFIDKNYFKTSSTLENFKFPENISEKQNISSSDLQTSLDSSVVTKNNMKIVKTLEKESKEILVEKEHSKNVSHSTTEEMSFFDENYFKKFIPKTENMNKSSSDAFEDPESTDYKMKKGLKSTDSFHTNLKFDTAEDKRIVTESSHVLNDYADSHKPAADLSSVKHETMKMNQFKEISNKDANQALRDEFARSNSSVATSKANVISKQKRQTENNTTPDSQAVKSDVKKSNDEEADISTAHDFVEKLRKENEVPQQKIKKGKDLTKVEKFDSKGFRILKNQVPDLTYWTREEILDLLKDNILYSDDDLLVLNKPYGLVMHDSQTTKSPCLSTFLNDLARELDQKSTDPKLLTVHRLDKETTGCLLLARNEKMAHHLKSLFAQRKIIKKYWIVTTRVPDPPAGVIDIPIAEGSVDNRKRMVLHAKLPKDIGYKNHSREGREAITSYEVIATSGNAALVEVIPKTGLKHQIRVHFGFGLSCPILGDHKYSHLDKLVPQKLQSDMLQKLKVRQSKVRHIPMHIHAKNVTIPQYFEDKNLFVNTNIPPHMRINLQRLKFRKKK